jgi:hypothetical protein
MSRAIILSLLLLLVPLSLPGGHGADVSGVPTARAAGTCEQKCLADQKECLLSGPCSTGNAGEQKECRRVCEQVYTFCVSACR